MAPHWAVVLSRMETGRVLHRASLSPLSVVATSLDGTREISQRRSNFTCSFAWDPCKLKKNSLIRR